MTSILLGDYISNPVQDDPLALTPYGRLEQAELADFLAHWDELHREALARIPERIHATAYIHPHSIVGDDVIIGAHAKVWEFSSVRKGAVLGAGVSVGWGCEVTGTFLGEGTILGHRIGLGRSIVGARAHLSASLMAAAISIWSDHMSRPEREIVMRAPAGIYRCRTSQFGALIGDGVQTGNNISLGPGVAIGRNCRISSGVTLAGRVIEEGSVISAPHVADVHVRRRRRRS
ncbi:LbetaH domain-containing protein [Peterkaempfera bronchialis]|uniref:Transferase n=1 Tax=Peterkaempfera bronchialis TaxID=2126346 RepID=A0A345T1V7_9ACTN|nr:transferase [Peterkaempfera bronchialis]AXI79962.1 transferase [Peterkaempfera bronchialis]